MSPFEDGGGGEGGGGGALVVSFAGVTVQGYVNGGPEADYLVMFNHSGSSPTPHTIDFTARLLHCGINGVPGLHAFNVVGSPDVPQSVFFQVVVRANPAANPSVTLGNYLGGEETPDVRDINGSVIPAEYGTPRVIFLNNY